MEEYFPPMGTDHQILDGREARPRVVLFIVGGAILVLMLLLGGIGWWKQRTHTFTVPNETITIDYSRKASRFLREEQHLPITNAWRTMLHAGWLPRIAGGSFNEPTWILAPRWARVPEGWVEGERYGLYQLLTHLSAVAASQPVQLRERSTWSLGQRGVIARGRLQQEQAFVSFALTSHILTTSLPATRPEAALLPGYDGSLILQNSALDSALFHRLVLENQGLSAWRQDIARFAWNAPSGAVSDWLLEVRNASSSLAHLLSTSSTINRVTLLADGSASIRRHTIPTTTKTLLQSGSSTNAPLATCIDSDFHPFFHLDGMSLDHVWSRISSHHPSLLQIGELGGRLSICFVERVAVDK